MRHARQNVRRLELSDRHAGHRRRGRLLDRCGPARQAHGKAHAVRDKIPVLPVLPYPQGEARTLAHKAHRAELHFQAGSFELNNIIKKEGIKNLLYMGVHENMCIMARPFAIEHLIGWGWPKERIAVVRELVDVM